jgi:hypothetical protein
MGNLLKKSGLLMFVVVVFGACSKESGIDYSIIVDVFGSVKSMKVERYSFVDSEDDINDREPTIVDSYSFSNTGELISYSENNSVAKVYAKKKGQLCKEFLDEDGHAVAYEILNKINEQEYVMQYFDHHEHLKSEVVYKLENNLILSYTLKLYQHHKVVSESTMYVNYDKDNLRSSISVGGETDKIIKIYEYKDFDENGNWIRRLNYENTSSGKKLSSVEIRTIEYYL